MPKVRIYLEDSYGTKFYRMLVARLKGENLFPRNVSLSCKRLSVFCNKKIDRDLRAILLNSDITGVILILDGDGNSQIKYQQANTHIPNGFPLKLDILLFDYEIEDLIFYSEGISINQKSSEYLKINRNYRKDELVRYAERLDLEIIKSHPVIKKLLEFVNSFQS